MEKYTIVLAHYNQMEYIEEAIKSIMKQDYKNIELIVIRYMLFQHLVL